MLNVHARFIFNIHSNNFKYKVVLLVAVDNLFIIFIIIIITQDVTPNVICSQYQL